jgi:hypothetical protein
MKSAQVKVSYRDRATGQHVELGTIDVPRFESVDEAIEYFNSQEPGSGVESVLDYVHRALDIELQNRFRSANRPDRPKSEGVMAKFRTLSPEEKKAALRAIGIEI